MRTATAPTIKELEARNAGREAFRLRVLEAHGTDTGFPVEFVKELFPFVKIELPAIRNDVSKGLLRPIDAKVRPRYFDANAIYDYAFCKGWIR